MGYFGNDLIKKLKAYPLIDLRNLMRLREIEKEEDQKKPLYRGKEIDDEFLIA